MFGVHDADDVDLAAHAGDLHGRQHAVRIVDAHDLGGNAETHRAVSYPRWPAAAISVAAATTACPSASPPSLGGTLAWVRTAKPAARNRSTVASNRIAFWKQPP